MWEEFIEEHRQTLVISSALICAVAAGVWLPFWVLELIGFVGFVYITYFKERDGNWGDGAFMAFDLLAFLLLGIVTWLVAILGHPQAFSEHLLFIGRLIGTVK
ncbi:MAG: hypothetical protein HGA31_06105 [Candidatus Moranbacteria bacterium]|nr:hypothetical protein [Candidatus Moranbacteria bacterium]